MEAEGAAEARVKVEAAMVAAGRWEARVKVEWAAAVGEGESDHHSKIVHLDHHSIVHLDHQLRAAKVKRLAQAKCMAKCTKNHRTTGAR